MASPAIRKAITEAASKYVKPEGKVFEYGTAGVSAKYYIASVILT
jgi:phosphoacetylglucosamine mutase